MIDSSVIPSDVVVVVVAGGGGGGVGVAMEEKISRADDETDGRIQFDRTTGGFALENETDGVTNESESVIRYQCKCGESTVGVFLSDKPVLPPVCVVQALTVHCDTHRPQWIFLPRTERVMNGIEVKAICELSSDILAIIRLFMSLCMCGYFSFIHRSQKN